MIDFIWEIKKKKGGLYSKSVTLTCKYKDSRQVDVSHVVYKVVFRRICSFTPLSSQLGFDIWSGLQGISSDHLEKFYKEMVEQTELAKIEAKSWICS